MCLYVNFLPDGNLQADSLEKHLFLSAKTRGEIKFLQRLSTTRTNCNAFIICFAKK